MVHVLHKTQNLAISRCCFPEDGKEMYKELNASALSLYCPLNHLFSDFIVFVFFFSQISSVGIYYDKEWAEDKEIMKKTLPSAVDNLDSMHTDFPHTEL